MLSGATGCGSASAQTWKHLGLKLFASSEEPCARRLLVCSLDQVSPVVKLSELLTSHRIDIVSAEVSTEDGVVSSCFVLQAPRPSDFDEALRWCRELEEFMEGNPHKGMALEGPVSTLLKRLSVNPDLLSVLSFEQMANHGGPPMEFRYSLTLKGINQAGLFAYIVVALYRSGFTVIRATLSTDGGAVSNSFELSTTSAEAEHLLRSRLDMPCAVCRDLQLPFQVSPADGSFSEMMHQWSRQPRMISGSMMDSQSCSGTSVHSSTDDDEGGGLQASHVWLSQGEAAAGRTRSEKGKGETAAGQSDCVAGNGLKAAKQPKQESRRLSVKFANGDAYTGCCILSQEGEMRHGQGTYRYSESSHQSYAQYCGQWCHDKKHGYGVLFYRNGGVYVGQWENNQKHGLGVQLDSSRPDSMINHEPMQMPTFRYEGQWYKDAPHGLGVEENEQSSYFGGFSHGKRHGRGVRMNHERLGVNSCEVMAQKGKCVPLLEALAAEMAEMAAAATAGRESNPSDVYQILDPIHKTQNWESKGCSARSSGGLASAACDKESNSSGNNSGESRGTMSSRWLPPSDTPVDTRPTPQLARSPCNPRSGSPTSNVTTAAPHSPITTANCLRARSRSASPCREGSPAPPASPVADRSNGSPVMVLALSEENDLLSPLTTKLHRPTPDASALSVEKTKRSEGDQFRPGALKATKSGIATEDIAPPPRRISAPELPKFKAEAAAMNGATAAGLALPDRHRSGAAAKKAMAAIDPQNAQQVRTPMLWSEDELAAFMLCLGLGTDLCARVLQQRFKGVSHFLEMTNSDWHGELGLILPVERLVLRQSLKRLLDADRWENSIRCQRVGDVLRDSVLAKFIVPLEDLTLLTKISQGGYGTVYRGLLDSSSGCSSVLTKRSQVVAVKEMKGERKVRLYELLKEARVMASLNHPNICTFIGVCTNAAQKKHYIISELMDCALFELIHQPYTLRWQGEWTAMLVMNLSKGICSGIGYLHGRNLVHADLKSSNILVDYSSSNNLVPRICDFGHAAVRTHPSPHHRCGTPHWMSPEVLRSEALGPESDVYSLAVIMWEMLTQKLPHKGLSFGQVLASVGWAGWTPDLDILPQVPTELRRLLKDCLAFSPAERPKSREVQRRLRRVVKHAQVKALQILAAFLS